MRKYILILIITLVYISCNGQNKDSDKAISDEKLKSIGDQNKGSWKVDKEFDEKGNLIKYDSIYSWSSNDKIKNLTSFDRDSLLQSFKSKFFTNFLDFENQGFEDVFAQDSLFSKHFFNDDFFESNFGKDFMDIDKIRAQMMERQKQFLKKYQSEFIKPKEEN
ncbi:hypothetical protein V8G56_12645 [Gaetbulibacter aquiaggeris]|uniref:Lipoprotein n=1 Tax=Gaetbulibacter aquiaggeris TaxID=1735373 RepID=A0ABW7MV54_9FLAO